MAVFQIDYDDVKPYNIGQVIVLSGKQYVLEKKTTTAVAVTRYYWFNRLWDKLTGHVRN